MRPLILTALLVLANPVQLVAQTMLILPQTTYPEEGTFCGFLTLCPQTEKTKDEG